MSQLYFREWSDDFIRRGGTLYVPRSTRECGVLVLFVVTAFVELVYQAVSKCGLDKARYELIFSTILSNLSPLRCYPIDKNKNKNTFQPDTNNAKIVSRRRHR